MTSKYTYIWLINMRGNIIRECSSTLYVGLQHAVHLLKSVHVHFAPGSDGRSVLLEYSWKFHLNCMVAAPGMLVIAGKTPGMLLIAGKKLKEACAARAVPVRFTCHCIRPINLASSKKATAAA